MSRRFTRRQILAQAGIAVAAIHTLDPHEICCAMAADAKNILEQIGSKQAKSYKAK